MKGILMKPDILKAKLKVLEQYGEATTRRLSGLKEINQEPDIWILVDPSQTIGYQGGFLFHNVKTRCHRFIKPRYQVGEIVYIKEAICAECYKQDGVEDACYKKDFIELKQTCSTDLCKWQSPLLMPAWAARYFIQITANSVERLQDIWMQEAILEGFSLDFSMEHFGNYKDPITKFREAWNAINPEYPFESNPYVFRYAFKLYKGRE